MVMFLSCLPWKGINVTSFRNKVCKDNRRHVFQIYIRPFFIAILLLFTIKRANTWNYGKYKLPTNGKRFNGRDMRSITSQFGFSIRYVPYKISRLNYPWISLPYRHSISLQQTRGRILYSSQRVMSNEGLGHAVSTNNADTSTAWRLNLTYSHRTARYGSLSQEFNEKFSKRSDYLREFQNAACVENFLGWGANEIPREAIQREICPSSIQATMESKCIVCLENERIERKNELLAQGKHRTKIRVDRVVQLPLNLSYEWKENDQELKKFQDQFLSQNNLPFTVFVLPPEKCLLNPANPKFTRNSYSYYFNKYWYAHESKTPRQRKIQEEKEEVHANTSISFADFLKEYSASSRLPEAIRRPNLQRLNELEVNIAVHVRRGDFFKAGRPMVPLRSFLNVLNHAIEFIKDQNDGVFSQMPISISFYSEGDARVTGPIGHDVLQMSPELVDVDGKPVQKDWVVRELKNAANVKGFLLQPYELKVHFRISEATILCLHEMIASDIFIGSDSGMSQQLVSSRSRAAMQFLPEIHEGASERQILFDYETGEISKTKIGDTVELWKLFVETNMLSAYTAVKSQK